MPLNLTTRRVLLAADHGRWRWIAAYIAVLSAISLVTVATAKAGKAPGYTPRMAVALKQR
jgi:hypothetical protein